MKIITLLLFSLLLTITLSQTADDDEVDTSIPNYPHKIYSGYFYLNVQTNPKAMHYLFYPSQNDRNADPLIVWFSGTPGCSSMLAAFHEIGPFVFLPGKMTFTRNENSWNKKANLLFLEIPAGTGYSDGPTQNITDDTYNQDALYTIRNFFGRYPTYKRNDFYLAGHGYGAVNIAHLAQKIIDENNNPLTIFNDDIKLKGILIGNPCVRPDECYATGSSKLSYFHYQFLNNRAFFSKKSWNDFRAGCLLNYDGITCYTEREKLNKQFKDTNTSMYNIYDKCYKAKNTTGLKYVNTGCEDDAGITNFLNDPSVKEHWNFLANKEWTPCNTTVFEEYRSGQNCFHLLPELIKNKIRIWVFSGDIDSYIPITGTRRWVDELRHTLEMPVRRIWREWWVPGRHSGEDQVGGFIWQLRDFTFVTVKAAGFRTAMDQPQAMSQILQAFIAGKTLPYKNT